MDLGYKPMIFAIEIKQGKKKSPRGISGIEEINS
jgi:hypothetical protein